MESTENGKFRDQGLALTLLLANKEPFLDLGFPIFKEIKYSKRLSSHWGEKKAWIECNTHSFISTK